MGSQRLQCTVAKQSMRTRLAHIPPPPPPMRLPCFDTAYGNFVVLRNLYIQLRLSGQKKKEIIKADICVYVG